MTNQKDKNQNDTNIKTTRSYGGRVLSAESGQRGEHRGNNTIYGITKKVEKITTALYMVTDFIDEREPLKREIKNASMELLDALYQATDAGITERTIFLVKGVSFIEKILGLMKIGNRLGMVSDMNHALIQEEIMRQRSIVEGEIKKVYHFRPSFEHISLSTENVTLPDDLFEDIERGGMRTQESLKTTNQKDTSKRQYIKTTNQKDTSRGVVLENKSKRRKDILELLRIKKTADITDITDHIKGVSRKTIQRELARLIKEGLIIKKGNKRWSTYIYAVDQEA